MKISKYFVLGALGVSCLAPAQQSVSLVPKYKKGDVDHYTMKMDISGGQMPMAITTSYTQKVVNIAPNGDVTLTVTPGDMTMNGKSMKMPAKGSTTVTMDKFGKYKSGTQGSNPMGMDMSALSGSAPSRPLKVGEVVPIDRSGKGGEVIKGTMKVLSISGGSAKVAMNYTVTTAQTGKMTMSGTSLFSTTSGKMNRMDATMSGMKMMPTAIIKMVLTRA